MVSTESNFSLLENDIKRSYNTLLNKLKSHKLDDESLIRIKNKFINDIDSPRRLNCIKSLDELIDLLDRRLLIHNYNVSNIYKIIETIEEGDINGFHQALINHHKLLLERNYSTKIIPYKESNSEVEIISDHEIPASVIDKISNCLGPSWKEIAYELGFKGGEVDYYEDKWETDSEKAYQVLNAYNHRGDNYKRERLLKALGNIRRRRLMDEVESMLMKSCCNCRNTYMRLLNSLNTLSNLSPTPSKRLRQVIFSGLLNYFGKCDLIKKWE